MPTINAILKEIKEVPADKLDELYAFVHSLSSKSKKKDSLRKKILSFGGAFSDLNNKDYENFKAQTNKTRSEIFNREIDI